VTKIFPFYFLFSHKFGDISHEKNLALGGSQAYAEVATKLDQCPVVAKPVSMLASLIAQSFPDSKKIVLRELGPTKSSKRALRSTLLLFKIFLQTYIKFEILKLFLNYQ
jgi:hypothetical protein